MLKSVSRVSAIDRIKFNLHKVNLFLNQSDALLQLIMNWQLLKLIVNIQGELHPNYNQTHDFPIRILNKMIVESQQIFFSQIPREPSSISFEHIPCEKHKPVTNFSSYTFKK